LGERKRNNHMSRNLVFFDTETTSKANGRLVQLAVGFDATGGQIMEMFFKPAAEIAIDAMEVHHITEERVKDCLPVDPEKLKPYFSGRTAVAHNAPFDIAVMAREGVTVGEYIDTLKVAQHLLPELSAHRLQYLRYALKLTVGESATAHDAGGDVEVLIALFKHLKHTAMALFSLDEDGAVEKMVELSNKKVLMKKLTFGKYRGQDIADLAKTVDGRQYLNWLRNQDDLGEDLKNTLDHYLCSSNS